MKNKFPHDTVGDAVSSLHDLKLRVRQFAQQRSWEKFHSPKNLAMALAIEVSELMEFFQWLTPDDAIRFCNNPQNKKKIEHEVADIAIYIFSICNALDIDLSSAIAAKMKLNAKKYPVSKRT